MIRVNVLYPAGNGVRFDFDYYLQRHIPMVDERMRPFGLTGITVDKGTAALVPGAPVTYVCVANLQFESIENMQQGLSQHGPEIMGDIPKYTDAQPVIQVSEVLI